MATTQINLIQRFANALFGVQVGSQTLAQVQAEISAAGSSISNVFNSYYTQSFASLSPAQIAAGMVERLGISVTGSTIAKNYIIDQLSNTPVAERGAKIAQILELYSGLTTDPIFGVSALAWNAQVEAASAYTGAANIRVGVGSSFTSVTGQENWVGTVFNDTFSVTLQGANPSLPAQGSFDGRAGKDVLNALLRSPSASIDTDSTARLVTRDVETISLQSQYTGNLPVGNARDDVGTRLDARASIGVKQWDNNSSTADLRIDNVSIRDDQVTQDITLTMRDTKAGDVDYSVFFDVASLRNFQKSKSDIRLELIDLDSAIAGLDPLLKNVEAGFVFTITHTNTGVSQVVEATSSAIQDARTYEQLALAFQNTIDAAIGIGKVAVSIGDTFTVLDNRTGLPVKGQQIKLTALGPWELSTPQGSGWLSVGIALPINTHSNFYSSAKSNNAPISSNIVLDQVGLGGTGGDLQVGAALGSIDDKPGGVEVFSNTAGVERFNIEVQGKSSLQTISSTSKALREVVLFNGVNPNSTDAAAVPGSLSVNGNGSAGSFGLSDVKIINGSYMRGDLSLTAEITEAAITRFVNDAKNNTLRSDSLGSDNREQASFIYEGGRGNDVFNVQINGVVAGNSLLSSSKTSFNFVLNGNAGNDNLTVSVAANGTGASANAWYDTQQLSLRYEAPFIGSPSWISSITIDAGEGNDIVRKPGWGNVLIDAGAGNDTVYSDNSGGNLKSVWLVSHDKSVAPQLGGAGGNQVTNLQSVSANNAPLFLYKGKLTVSFSGDSSAAFSGGVTGHSGSANSGLADADTPVAVAGAGGKLVNGWESTVDIIPTPLLTSASAIDQLSINQAIKRAINDDAVLSKLLVAVDGPGNTLQITSLIDGQFAAGDLDFKITAPTSSSATGGLNVLNTTEAAAAQSAYQAFLLNLPNQPSPGSSWENANTNSTTTLDTRLGTGLSFAGVGARSSAQTDNVIDLGTGNDLAVLSSSAQANEVIDLVGDALGKDSIVNFDDGSSSAGLAGQDSIDLRSYLFNRVAATAADTDDRISTTSNTNTLAELNEVIVLNTLNFNQTPSAGSGLPANSLASSFSGLTAEKLKAALNGTTAATDYAGITGATLDALTGSGLTAQTHVATSSNGSSVTAAAVTRDFVGQIGSAVLIIENDDNLGEYVLYRLIWNTTPSVNTNREFSDVRLIGVMDFGSSVNFTVDNYLTRNVIDGVLL
jgi:hypothetical protein